MRAQERDERQWPIQERGVPPYRPGEWRREGQVMDLRRAAREPAPDIIVTDAVDALVAGVITPQVVDCLRESGVQEGLVLVNAMHITASVFINDDERGLFHDFDVWLEKLAPHEPVAQYQHNSGEDSTS